MDWYVIWSLLGVTIVSCRTDAHSETHGNYMYLKDSVDVGEYILG